MSLLLDIINDAYMATTTAVFGEGQTEYHVADAEHTVDPAVSLAHDVLEDVGAFDEEDVVKEAEDSVVPEAQDDFCTVEKPSYADIVKENAEQQEYVDHGVHRMQDGARVQSSH